MSFILFFLFVLSPPACVHALISMHAESESARLYEKALYKEFHEINSIFKGFLQKLTLILKNILSHTKVLASISVPPTPLPPRDCPADRRNRLSPRTVGLHREAMGPVTLPVRKFHLKPVFMIPIILNPIFCVHLNF